MDLLNHIMAGYTPILIFIFLCFAALMIFFIKLSRNLEELIRIARYDRTALLDQLAVMQSSLEDLVYYQADVSNILRGLYEGDADTPYDESDQPLPPGEDAVQAPYDAYEDLQRQSTATREPQPGTAATAAIAGTAAGIAAGTQLFEQDTDAGPFDEVPDLADLVDDDEAFFDTDAVQTPESPVQDTDSVLGELDLTLDETMPPAEIDAPDISQAAAQSDYDTMASETMEFNDDDYAHYSSALAEKQAKEDFKITPETDVLDALTDEPEVEMPAFNLDDISDDSDTIISMDAPGLDLSDEDIIIPEEESDDISLDLEASDLADADLQDQVDLTDSFDLALDHPEPAKDTPEYAPPAGDDLEISLDDELPDLDLDQADVPELIFHEEPESHISLSPEEEEDSVYLLDEPLTSEEAPDAADDLPEFDLSDAPTPNDSLTDDALLDSDLASETIREIPSYETVPEEALETDLVMDLPETEETPGDEFDLEPQHIDLDFQLEPDTEDTEARTGLGDVSQQQGQEVVLEDDAQEDDEDVIMMDDDYADDDDSDLDLLVDNLLDVPEEVSLDSDAEDSPDYETAIIIDEDDDLHLDNDATAAPAPATPSTAAESQDLFPEADITGEDLVVDTAPADIADDDSVFDVAQPQPSAETDAPGSNDEIVLETANEDEMSTKDMMLTLDNTIELDKNAADSPVSADDPFTGDELLSDNALQPSHEFLLDGLMDLPSNEQDSDFSFSGEHQDDPFSLQDLDITILDQTEHEGVSLDSGDDDAAEDDIVLPDVSFKNMPDEEDRASVGHADNLLELETDDLVEAESPDLAVETPSDSAPEKTAGTKSTSSDKKSANILDFIIDE